MLIAFEGIHGCGKSTQIDKLENWLVESQKSLVYRTEWNAYPTLRDLSRELKLSKKLTPLSHSIIHSLDLILRYEQDILKELSERKVVIVDRYIYTSYVRDGVRGVRKELLDAIYYNFKKPDIIFYFDIDPNISLERVKENIILRNPYVLGEDIEWIQEENELMTFLRYQQEQKKFYPKVFSELDTEPIIINAEQDINTIHSLIKAQVEKRLNLSYLLNIIK